jgi:hypothetical protein
MTDVHSAELSAVDPAVSAAGVEMAADTDEKAFKVPVTKGKGTLDVYLSKLPDAVYREMCLQGLKVLLNRGMTKITKETYPNPEELKAAAMAQAEKTVQACYEGKIRIMGAKADKVSGAVMTEARRLARNLVKDELKKSGVKISYVEASEITKAANALIAADPSIVKSAEESLKAREEKAAGMRTALAGIITAVPQSEKKKQKIEAEKAKAKETLSKTQAGKVATAKQRPQANA